MPELSLIQIQSDEKPINTSRLVNCRICEWEYLPDAHFNHCPICGTLREKFRGMQLVFNGTTLRTIERVIPHSRRFIEGIINR